MKIHEWYAAKLGKENDELDLYDWHVVDVIRDWAKEHDVHQQYSADEFAPEIIGSGYCSAEVVCVEDNVEVWYNYDDKMWYNFKGGPLNLEGKHWRYPKAIRLEEKILSEIEVKESVIEQSDYDKGYHDASKAIANIDKNRMKAKYKKGYADGYQEAAKLVNTVQEMRADAKYKLLAETFEEFLSDRVVIKELKDFWRNRAGLPTAEKDTKQ